MNQQAGPAASSDSAPTSQETAGPLPAYRRRAAEGKLQSDPAQLLAAEKLQALHNALGRGKGNRSWRERLGLAQRSEETQGLYIFGAVGRGKSMLMDLFFAGAPVAKKRRVHFLAFMLEVHEQLPRLAPERERRSDPELAQSIARRGPVCSASTSSR